LCAFEAIFELKGQRNARVAASREWVVDFFSKGPPPLVIEFLHRRDKTRFYEKLAKLLDIQKSYDSRSVLIISAGTIGPEDIRLASNFEIYVVSEDDEDSFRTAVSGGDLEINRVVMEKIISRKSRKFSKDCRVAILDLLEKRWLTAEELKEQLRWRYSKKTVNSQIRTLRKKGDVFVIGRTTRGKGILGIPGRIYYVREDLSNPTKTTHLSRAVVDLLKSAEHPMPYDWIANSLGAKKHEITAVLRGLAKKGEVKRERKGWIA
jgi:predicted transcriptional regulator